MATPHPDNGRRINDPEYYTEPQIYTCPGCNRDFDLSVVELDGTDYCTDCRKAMDLLEEKKTRLSAQIEELSESLSAQCMNDYTPVEFVALATTIAPDPQMILELFRLLGAMNELKKL